jgi:hypothetical protein
LRIHGVPTREPLYLFEGTSCAAAPIAAASAGACVKLLAKPLKLPHSPMRPKPKHFAPGTPGRAASGRAVNLAPARYYNR